MVVPAVAAVAAEVLPAAEGGVVAEQVPEVEAAVAEPGPAVGAAVAEVVPAVGAEEVESEWLAI